MGIIFDASRWPPMAIAVTLTLVACSGTASVASLPPSPTVLATPTTSELASTSGPVATTEPADVAPPGATTVGLTSFTFEPKSVTANVGTAVFFLANKDAAGALGSGVSHNMVIGSELGQPIAASSYVPGGDSAIFTVDGLGAGSYVIWCSVPHHADNGMVGTLTVTP
jgi:plastocyanin